MAKNKYTKTQWIDNKTPINAENLNKIENELETLSVNNLNASDLIPGKGVKVNLTEHGAVRISTKINVEIITEEQTCYDKSTVYFLVVPDNGAYLQAIIINGIKTELNNGNNNGME